ncbi:hypothetical protein AXG93_3256s1200 [Marchantia polymorpha subsp. ruderalis]|uniref:Peptidase M20 dimerisation domain-containing protein n=1 Tax=Marchantia polymorpha subsp. ruderalis TaxID=1480154 RepID=A0A176VIY6_MARPO|nr:hypothetical protein AXG93_3256s1200 [Marchantia polymorpha subsp. ruderalis]
MERRSMMATAQAWAMLLCLSAVLLRVSASSASVESTLLPGSSSPVEFGVAQGPDEENVNSVIRAAAHSPDMIEWVQTTLRYLHSHPELSWQEFETSAFIRKQLDSLGIRYEWPVAKTGVVGIIGSGNGPCIALRADMDALPIQEEAETKHPSLIAGRMHACGHDAHVTVLLGVAKLLQARRHLIPVKSRTLQPQACGTIRLVFQPAEEGNAGAQVMVEEGALGNAESIFGLHVTPFSETGTVALKPGPLMAGSGMFEALIMGKGGHAALPQLLTDPILAAATTVIALQQLVAREADPLDSQVVSVSILQAGKAYNVCPDNVRLGGTFRAFSLESFRRLKQRIEEVIVNQAAVHKCAATVDFIEDSHPFYPPTINDEKLYEHVHGVAVDMLGKDKVLVAHPVMGAEDFAFYLQKIPGFYMLLGMRNVSYGSTFSGHTSRFVVDEHALPYGVSVMAAVAETYLKKLDSQRKSAARGDQSML